MEYSVEPSIFERFPGFRRLVVVAEGVDNSVENPALLALLRHCEAEARGEAPADFRTHPALAAWCACFTAMGLNPNRYPPSVVNLIKRTRSGKDLPYINSLVAIFNCISLKYLVPCGGDDRAVITGDLRLGFASGQESYVPLGQPDVVEHPPVGEVIYYDTGNLDVFCRAWCWKNGDRSKMSPATTAACINVDAMAPVDAGHLEKAADELAALIRTHTGGTTRIHALSPEQPRFTC